MSVTLNGTSGLVFSDGTIQGTAAGMPFRNRIINGDMRIDQRNNGNTITPSSIGVGFSVDRWSYNIQQASKLSFTQGVTSPPPGFNNFVRIAVVSAYTPAAGEYFLFQQRVEGYNISDLAWGTANAKTATLSFWVRSSLTGSFGGSVRSRDGTYVSYPFSYTINSANTWEYKTITISGPTSGAFGSTNDVGFTLYFSMGSGSSVKAAAGSWISGGPVGYLDATTSSNIVQTSGATWDITGVQLEKAAAATDFEFRPYGTELAMCQRYFFRSPTTGAVEHGSYAIRANYTGSNEFFSEGRFPVTMRTIPSMSLTYLDFHKPNVRFDSVIVGSTGVSSNNPSTYNMFVMPSTTDSNCIAGRLRELVILANAEL